jgi:Raf kinase inhibitor-like YbhB/YbcL family protein
VQPDPARFAAPSFSSAARFRIDRLQPAIQRSFSMQKGFIRSTFILMLGLALGIGVAAQAPQGGGAPGAGAPGAGAQGGGRGGGRAGGRGGFNLPPLLMESEAFPDGGIIPVKYAGRGGSLQPGFKISNAPEGTVAYAIIFHDIDVSLQNGTGDVLHWMAWDIPASAGGIPEGKLPEGSVQGNNMQGKPVYMGPGAPAGPRYHHYVFELYALNANLGLAPTASRDDVLKALQGKVVAKAAYVGRYRTEAQ